MNTITFFTSTTFTFCCDQYCSFSILKLHSMTIFPHPQLIHVCQHISSFQRYPTVFRKILPVNLYRLLLQFHLFKHSPCGYQRKKGIQNQEMTPVTYLVNEEPCSGISFLRCDGWKKAVQDELLALINN